MNPFSPPNARRPGPLCPWRFDVHLKYYVAVDHTEQAFADFVAESERWLSNGRSATLITGEDGCGKSSLAHRCVSHLKARLTAPEWIVDLSEEKHPHGRTIPQKLRLTLDAIADSAADSERLLPKNDRDYIFAAPADDVRQATRLSNRLTKNNRTLVILVPRIELEQELRDYLGIFYRAGIILFMESSNPLLDSFCASRYGPESDRPILRLRVAKIAGQDGVLFKNARLALLSEDPDQPLPGVNDGIIEEFLTARTARSFGVSVRELEKVCEYAFAAALKRGDTEVQYKDIANYYVENAPR